MLSCLQPHLLSSANFSQFQSVYRKGHSTDTALLDDLDRVFTMGNDKQVTVLIRLDLPTASDTVDHQYNDTQLHLTMHTDNTSAGLSVLAKCQSVVPAEQSAAQPGQVGMTNQLLSSVSSVSVAGVDLLAADKMKCWGHDQLESEVPQACLGGGVIVQLPNADHPAHSAPADCRTYADAGL